MNVYKFGGASVKDAMGVKNVLSIIRNYKGSLVVVVSAMGKTTNALEQLMEGYFNGEDINKDKQNILDDHKRIITDLFDKSYEMVRFNSLWNEFEHELNKRPSLDFDYDYDRIVSFGELFSTTIISEYLAHNSVRNEWVDARQILRTSNHYREAKVLWDISQQEVNKRMNDKEGPVFITQGFLGSTLNNQTTTLGREGSDFTAAALAFLLDAEAVTIWKDVPGVFNADPKWFNDAQLIKEISYKETIELSFYGAQIIHPKTLKPLQNKLIPLFVKSFDEPEKEGTMVCESAAFVDMPIYIKKSNQALLSINPIDFSFIMEDNIRDIFDIFSQFRAKVNLMQNSALSFSVCINYDERKFPSMVNALKQEFAVSYNLDVELLTIRHYRHKGVIDLTKEKQVFVEQRTRNTASYILS